MSAQPIILFDGFCNLCIGSVLFVIRRDPKSSYRFAPMQSEIGRQLLSDAGLTLSELSTFVLIQNGKVFTRSDAALQVLASLGRMWRIFRWMTIIPKPVRDWFYDFIARNRYSWFGKREVCMVPDEEIQSRFLN